MVRIKIRTAIFALLISALPIICFAEKQIYHNTECHFSFIIPEEWQEIPKEAIDEYYKNIKLPSGFPASAKVTIPNAWFQKKAEGDFKPQPPYLSIMIDDVEAKDIPKLQKERQLELKLFYFKSKEYKLLKEKLKNIPTPSFSDFVRLGEFKATVSGEGMYDAARNLFISTGASLQHFKDKGRQLFINVRAFYKCGTVHLSFHTLEKDLQKDLVYFEEIMSSFHFDEGFECPAIQERRKR